MLMLQVLASQLYSAITQTTWFGYKTLYFIKFNAFRDPTMSFITFALDWLTINEMRLLQQAGRI